jgi:hypothetical protein
LPWPDRSRTVVQKACLPSTSIPTVGSSSTSSSGLLTSDGESEPLGLAAAEALRAPIGDRLDLREREHFVNLERLGEERGDHRHELTRGQLAQDPARLEHDPDPALLNRLFGRCSKDRNRSRVGRLKAEQHVDRGRVAGPVRPEQRDGLARVHGDVDASNRANRPCGDR